MRAISIAAAAAAKSRVVDKSVRCATSHLQYATESASASAATSNDSDSDKMKTLKHSILQESIRLVHQHGWTQQSILMATATIAREHQQQLHKNCSLSVAAMLSPNDMIQFCLEDWYHRLEQRQDFHTMTLSDALQLRLSYVLEDNLIHSWHTAMALGAHPSNALDIQATLRRTMDLIVRNCCSNGLHVSDVHKLALLYGVFVPAELHLLSDRSLGHEQRTWEFLHGRVQAWQANRDALQVAEAVGAAALSGMMALMSRPQRPHQQATYGTDPAHYSTAAAAVKR
jgi:rpsU-divergently transcribed protein